MDGDRLGRETNIDEMIRERGVKTVTVRDTEGKEYEGKAEVFLPSMR